MYSREDKKKEPKQIRRDTFTRTSLYRRVESMPACCSWCGNKARFNYGTVHDGFATKVSWERYVFCSLECRDTYQEMR